MLLRRYKEQPVPTCSSIIGVDDFAFKKGRRYGTAIVDGSTHAPIAILEGRYEQTLKEWLQRNKHVTVITRDRAAAYAKAIEEVLPDCMQIADRFHLHKNLMDAVNKILNIVIPEIIEVPVEENCNTISHGKNNLDAQHKKTSENNFTEAEQKRMSLITTIQELRSSNISLAAIANILKKDWRIIKKYINVDPKELCHNKLSVRQSALDIYTYDIIDRIKQGMTQSSIAKELINNGYTGTKTNARMHVCLIAQKYGLKLSKYGRKTCSYDKADNEKLKIDCITRRGIFYHLWMDEKLTKHHHYWIWNKYNILQTLEKCIRQFREIFNRKVVVLLYIFIDRYGKSSIRELVSFVKSLSRDIKAVGNAVASTLSNGFVRALTIK